MIIQIEIEQLETNLPRYVSQVEAGDTVVVCKDQIPIAELRPIKKKRPLGLGQGEIVIAPNCFDPLPEEILKGFEGNLNEAAS